MTGDEHSYSIRVKMAAWYLPILEIEDERELRRTGSIYEIEGDVKLWARSCIESLVQSAEEYVASVSTVHDVTLQCVEKLVAAGFIGNAQIADMWKISHGFGRQREPQSTQGSPGELRR